MRYALLGLGTLAELVGIVWLLQGVGVLPGSFMTGQTFWAVAGGIFVVVGNLLILAGIRMNRRR